MLNRTALLLTLLSPAVMAEEKTSTSSGWFRFDHDALGLQMWAGATHDLPGPIDFASNIYLFPQKTTCDEVRCYTSTYGEVDLGAFIQAGPFLFIPMSGVGIDWDVGELVTIVTPQLYAYFDVPEVHIEWWSNIAWNSWLTEGTDDIWYNRLFVLYNMIDELSVGPQAEMEFIVNGGGIPYLPVGGRANLTYGEKNTLGLFYGYNLQVDNTSPLAGRITFVRYW